MNQRIIGCGSPFRGDDAVGLVVARKLRESGADAIEHAGDGLALIESWEGAEAAILIDAVVTGGEAGTIHVWDVRDMRAIEDAYRYSSHGFGVAEALRMAIALGRLPPRLTIYGIEANRFEVGAGLSAEVAEAAGRLARRLGGKDTE